jgi:hypothetical protein
MMDIDFDLLGIFEILYDERQFTRAAARLFPYAICGQSCARAAQECTGRFIVHKDPVGPAADGARASACAEAASSVG